MWFEGKDHKRRQNTRPLKRFNVPRVGDQISFYREGDDCAYVKAEVNALVWDLGDTSQESVDMYVTIL